MIKSIFFILFSLSLISCASKSVELKHNKNSFEQENKYILFALYSQNHHDYKSAELLFNKLYLKTSKKEYLYSSLSNSLHLKQYKKIINRVDDITKGSFDDYKLIRFKIFSLVELGKIKEAENVAFKLANKTKLTKDEILLSEIYIQQNKYKKAVQYLKLIYNNNYNEEILVKMTSILYYKLNKREDAIKYLKTNIEINGCSKVVCSRLLKIYSEEENADGILSVYKRLYSLDKNKKVAKKIIELYVYKKEYIALMNFLESSNANDKLLFELYVVGKNYLKASSIALKLYDKSGDISYLGESAIYKYEGNLKRLSKKDFLDVVTKLKKVVKETNSPFYENYLGYILIDNNKNVKEGMKYIRHVLKYHPESVYYLDSLAWGYYKLKECKKAKNIFNKIKKMQGSDNLEVIKHIKAVNACVKHK